VGPRVHSCTGDAIATIRLQGIMGSGATSLPTGKSPFLLSRGFTFLGIVRRAETKKGGTRASGNQVPPVSWGSLSNNALGGGHSTLKTVRPLSWFPAYDLFFPTHRSGGNRKYTPDRIRDRGFGVRLMWHVLNGKRPVTNSEFQLFLDVTT
jgi:hypothetical protein